MALYDRVFYPRRSEPPIRALVQLVLFSGGFYIALRAAGKIIGSYLGALISDSDKITKNWMGIALLPQAGVAIGMALVATQSVPTIPR